MKNRSKYIYICFCAENCMELNTLLFVITFIYFIIHFNYLLVELFFCVLKMLLRVGALLLLEVLRGVFIILCKQKKWQENYFNVASTVAEAQKKIILGYTSFVGKLASEICGTQQCNKGRKNFPVFDL